jgi:hypothetical protein
MQGFISLHRKLMDNPIWTDSNYLKLWIYCLFEASHKEHEILVGNQMVKLERGQFVKGRFALSEDMNRGVKPKQKLNDKTWWRYLENLEKWGMLTIKPTNKFSLITIDKYDFYQSVFNKTDQQMSNSCPTNDQQMSTNNNGNKGNKKDTRQKQVYDDTSLPYKLSVYFYERILENNPEHKQPNLQTWSEDVRKMLEIDNRTEEQIRYLMKWVQEDDFEKVNVLSPSKLRKRFDQLVLKVKQQKGNKKQEPNRQPKQNTNHLKKMEEMWRRAGIE